MQVGPAAPTLLLENSEASYNGTNGINELGSLSPTHTIVRITNMTITGNVTGLALSAGEVISFGNNKNDGNTTNGSPVTTISQQ